MLPQLFHRLAVSVVSSCIVNTTLQVLADAPVMDTQLPISPLDAHRGRIKQEDCQELHVSHSARDIDYQVSWLQNLATLIPIQ